MEKTVIVHDIGAANFLPPHFPLDGRFEYVHFEPDPRGLSGLKKWLDSKKTKARHKFFNHAIGEASQMVKLALAQKNTSSAIAQPGFEGKQVDVSMEPLQSVITENNLEYPDIVKIDVEGYELKVLEGIDLLHKKLRVVEVEVTLNSNTLSDVISLLTRHQFKLAKVRTHGDQDYNPRNWLRGKIHGFARKFNFANYGVVRSEESWAKPTTPLTQIEFVFTRGLDLRSEDSVDLNICDIYGLAHRKSASASLMCGARKVNIFDDFTLIR